MPVPATMILGFGDEQVLVLLPECPLLWEVNTKTPGVPWNSVQGYCAVMDSVVCVGSRRTFT